VTVQRSAVADEFSGVKIYRAVVSARKMGEKKTVTKTGFFRPFGCC
jgi:hypothetical protein